MGGRVSGRTHFAAVAPARFCCIQRQIRALEQVFGGVSVPQLSNAHAHAQRGVIGEIGAMLLVEAKAFENHVGIG